MEKNKEKAGEKGYVYILTNDSFKEDWIKIGRSSRPVNIRSKELDNTAVPLPFKIYATIRTVKYRKVEELVHDSIDQLTALRIRPNREFFNIAPQKALEIFQKIAGCIDDAVITVYKDNKPNYTLESGQPAPRTAAEEERAKRFQFSMIGLKVGDEVTFSPTGLAVRVADDNTIEYQGKIYKLTSFVKAFLPEDQRNSSGSYRGPDFFTHNGETLTKLRIKTEKLHQGK